MELITGTVIKRKNSCRLTTDSGEEYNLKFATPQLKYFIGNRSKIRVRGIIKGKKDIQVLEAESFAYVATSEEIRTLAEETGITIDRGKLEEEITASSSTSIDELINKIENGKYEPKYPELAKQLLAISKKIKQNREILNLYQYFSDIGMIDIPLLFSIYDAFERRAKLANTSVTELIKENPYLLLQVEGFPVQTALEIAETKGKFSKEQKEIFSCMAEILQSISKFQQKGHNYTFLNIIYAEMSKKYDSNTIKKALENLQYGTYGKKFGRTVLIKDEAVKVTAQEYFKNPPANPAALYLPGTFFAEKNGAETLGKLISKNFTSPFDFKKVSEIVDNKYSHLSEAQKVFIKTALGGRITVLTGGAGTGKTTALHAIADIVYELTGKMPVIMAPTAVAAFRAAEGTIVGQNESKYGTIHRLLKIITRETDEYVDTGEEKEGIIIDADFVIVDESSMLTPLNFQKLLNCITNKTQMVFAGDPNQLPPIKNAGVFPTLIALGRDKTVPNIHLIEFTQQFRSSLSLLRNAYRVLEGEAIQFDGEELKFIKAEKDRTIKEKVWETIIQLMEEQGIKEFNPYEILVLTPRNLGQGGTRELNAYLAKKFNPEGEKISGEFRTGDWVICTKNDYKDISRSARYKDRGDVYNGERGRIIEYDRKNEITVVEYYTPGNCRKEKYNIVEMPYFLEPCYAMTVHKAQGTQGSHVILVLFTEQHNRNLIFTALTRTKENGKAIILTDESFLGKPAYCKEQKTINFSRFEHIVRSNITSQQYREEQTVIQIKQSLIQLLQKTKLPI